MILLQIGISGCMQPKTIRVAIQPLGEVPLSWVDSIQKALTIQYGFEVLILDEVTLPKSAFVQIKTPRYRADSLLVYLKKLKPKDFDYIIGITQKDISTSKKTDAGKVKQPHQKYFDWGIMGLATRPGKSCVISSFRIQHKNKEIFYSRLQKIAVHELGHNLGLKHCEASESCVMRDAAESVKTIDHVEGTLCESCKKLIN